MTTKRFGERFRGKLGFDGLFSDNIPRFTDNVRPQLVFDLGKVQYALSALVQATDPCIEALAVRAAPPHMLRRHTCFAATHIAATRVAATHTAATQAEGRRSAVPSGQPPALRAPLPSCATR